MWRVVSFHTQGADASVSLQPLAPAFKRTGPAPRPGPPPAPVKCGDSCEITKGMDTHNHGIVSPPVTMPDQTGKKTRLFAQSILKMIILPRQARDKHMENSKQRCVFL
jgi:hypothetical protein